MKKINKDLLPEKGKIDRNLLPKTVIPVLPIDIKLTKKTLNKKFMNKNQELLYKIIQTHPRASITVLMKIIYIIDLISFKDSGKQISNLEWKRYFYGPFNSHLYIEAGCSGDAYNAVDNININNNYMNMIQVSCRNLDHRGGMRYKVKVGLFYIRLSKKCILCGGIN